MTSKQKKSEQKKIPGEINGGFCSFFYSFSFKKSLIIAQLNTVIMQKKYAFLNLND